MTREAVLEKLNDVFQDVFDDENIMVGEETSMSSIALGSSNIDDWDSLEHINLVVAVERCFGIKFNMGEVSTIKNVGAMVDIILERMQ